jgi:hypothetical protein
MALYNGDSFAWDTLTKPDDFGLRGIAKLPPMTITDDELSAKMCNVPASSALLPANVTLGSG